MRIDLVTDEETTAIDGADGAAAT